MTDFDLSGYAKNKDVWGSLIGVMVFSISITVGLYWKDYTQEILSRFYPHDLLAKGIFGVFLTVAGIYLSHYLLRKAEAVKPAGKGEGLP